MRLIKIRFQMNNFSIIKIVSELNWKLFKVRKRFFDIIINFLKNWKLLPFNKITHNAFISL